jgi:hypothetical protein
MALGFYNTVNYGFFYTSDIEVTLRERYFDVCVCQRIVNGGDHFGAEPNHRIRRSKSQLEIERAFAETDAQTRCFRPEASPATTPEPLRLLTPEGRNVWKNPASAFLKYRFSRKICEISGEIGLRAGSTQ